MVLVKRYNNISRKKKYCCLGYHIFILQHPGFVIIILPECIIYDKEKRQFQISDYLAEIFNSEPNVSELVLSLIL